MSYTSITQSTEDKALQERIRAAISKEAWKNETYGNTPIGQQVRRSWPNLAVEAAFTWPCCLDFETEYEYALNAGNPNPGGDPTVITDAAIQSSIQTHWPMT